MLKTIGNIILGAILIVILLMYIAIAPKILLPTEGICEISDLKNGSQIAFCNGEARPKGNQWRFFGFAKSNPTYRVYINAPEDFVEPTQLTN